MRSPNAYAINLSADSTGEREIVATTTGVIEHAYLVHIFGIIIRMWHDDHPPPHIHVEYQGFEALVEIQTGEITKGQLPNKAAAMVKEWCLRHQAELQANWEHGQRFEPMERIPGADYDD